MEKEVWVVWCKVEGCDECSTTYSIIGVFDSLEAATETEKEHSKLKHLHCASVDVDRVTINQATHSWGDKNRFPR